MPVRIQLRRTKGWRKPADAVVVARPTRWGNPFTLDRSRGQHPHAPDAELRALAVHDFRAMVEHRGCDAAGYPSLEEIRRALAGHDLACWCPLDQPCHADVLLDLAGRTG